MSLRKCPIGIYEKALLSKSSWKERLMMAKDAGYDFLEISIDESEERLSRLDWNQSQRLALKEAIHESGIPILTMCLSGNRKYPIGSEDTNTRIKGINLIMKAIDFSVDIGIRCIQLAGYDEYAGEHNPRTEAGFFESLNLCTRYASQKGVMLAIETMDTEFINSIEKAKAYVDRINSPWLQIYPDVGNISGWHMNVEADVKTGIDHIVAFHLKDTKSGVFRRIPFGEGIVDFEGFFTLLSDLDYKAPFVVEMWSDDAEDAFWEAKKAREYLQNLMDLSHKQPAYS